MKRYEVLRNVVILQAVCMIALSVVVVIRIWPNETASPGNNELDAPTEQSLESVRSEVIASVGDKAITAGELADKLQEQYGDSMLQLIMTHKALELEAESSGITVSALESQRELENQMDGYDSEDQFFRFMSTELGISKEQVLEDIHYKLLLEKLAIRSIKISDEEVESYIEEHAEQYAPQVQLHLKWVVTESRSEAEEVISRLQTGESFSSLARLYSIDEFTSDSGGDLGFIDDDDPFYESEILETASRLQVAELAGPIQIENGYAVIQLVERQITTALTGRRLHDEVRKQLALEQAQSLKELEEQLLVKYNAGQKE